jgi:hypothetical protein
MFKVAVAFLLTIFGVGSAWAGALKAESDIRSFSDNVMSSVIKGGVPAAFATMKQYMITPEAEFQSAALSSQSQREQFGARYGKTVGYEFIGQKKLGESLVMLTYIEKTEKHALPWRFYFYKTPTGWILNSFNWNDQMPQLFLLER